MSHSKTAGPFSGGSRYNPYGLFLKEKFGCRVYKVGIDGGFTCPNRDGSIAIGGCTYCDNDSFSPQTASRAKPVSEQVKEGITHLRRRYGATKFIAYFQQFTNTYASLDALSALYEEALGHPDIVGLSLATRPDCIDEAKIAWLERRARKHFITVEYGLESVYDTTLARINRGHTYRCWLDAMNRTRNRGIWLCAHLILGFPWETRDQMLATAEVLSDKGLDFLKLHHLHVVRHTALAEEYRKQPFPLMTLDYYADLVVDFLEQLNPAIRLERLSGFAPNRLLLGPIWSKSKVDIHRSILARLAAREAFQGRLYKSAAIRLQQFSRNTTA